MHCIDFPCNCSVDDRSDSADSFCRAEVLSTLYVSVCLCKVVSTSTGRKEGRKEVNPRSAQSCLKGAAMPKKMGTNSKAEEARARKAEAHVEKKVKEERMKEESYWKEAEGPVSKAAKKREEEAERRAEAAAKKLEAKKLAEQEEKELDKYGKRVDKKATRVAVPVPKVTAAELAKRKEEEQAALAAQAAAAKKRELRMSNPDEYEKLVSVSNRNREDDLVDARDLESALAQIGTLNAPELPADRHPERRLKASYKAFEESELPILKEEKPGLTHTQYKDMLWKLWKKSPDNPLNQDK